MIAARQQSIHRHLKFEEIRRRSRCARLRAECHLYVSSEGVSDEDVPDDDDEAKLGESQPAADEGRSNQRRERTGCAFDHPIALCQTAALDQLQCRSHRSSRWWSPFRRARCSPSRWWCRGTAGWRWPWKDGCQPTQHDATGIVGAHAQHRKCAALLEVFKARRKREDQTVPSGVLVMQLKGQGQRLPPCERGRKLTRGDS